MSVMPSWRSAATKVVVFPCPGVQSPTRSGGIEMKPLTVLTLFATLMLSHTSYAGAPITPTSFMKQCLAQTNALFLKTANKCRLAAAICRSTQTTQTLGKREREFLCKPGISSCVQHAIKVSQLQVGGCLATFTGTGGQQGPR
jgi:hypothetical protein